MRFDEVKYVYFDVVGTRVARQVIMPAYNQMGFLPPNGGQMFSEAFSKGSLRLSYI